MEGRVGRLEGLQVIDEETARVVRAAGDVDHPRRTDLPCSVHDRHEQPGEQGMAQVVDLIVVLEAITRVRLLHEHHTGIVHQNVQRFKGFIETRRKVADGVEVAKVD